MLRNHMQRRVDALLGRQVREVANALHELAISGGSSGISSIIHKNDPPLLDSTPEERLASLSSVVEGMVPPGVASSPYRLWGGQLRDGSPVISIGIHRGAAKLALPPAVSDYVRHGATRPRAVA